MLIDLQLHSTYSDGYFTPTKLAEYIAREGVKVASLTDHNTVGGLDEFCGACLRHGIKPIRGVELYCKYNKHRFNILWYNFNDNDPELHNMLRVSQMHRRRFVRAALKRLVKRGFKINADELLDNFNHYIPINHVVDEVVSNPRNLAKIKRELKDDNPREGEIISHYFKNKTIGVLKNCLINFERVVELKKKIGGQLILCHPAKNHKINPDFWIVLKEMGLAGVEMLSPHHSLGSLMYIQSLAREFKLITSGGSDFHRPEGAGYRIQGAWSYYKIDTKYLRGIKKIIGA